MKNALGMKPTGFELWKIAAVAGARQPSGPSQSTDNKSHLFAKPRVSWFARESRMPSHEIRKDL
jgi:hypothetical protein